MALAPEISVIIPCYGHSVELKACLDGLQNQQGDVPFEIIVVDSSSGSHVEEIINRYAKVRLIRSENRLFPGAARNVGAREAASEKLAFLDADCIPHPDWIQRAHVIFQTQNQVIGGPILDVHPIHPIAWVDNRLQFVDFQQGRPAGKFKHVPTCNMLVSKELYAQTGGFREDLLTGEDVLFTVEFPNGVWFDPALRVCHQGRRVYNSFLEHQRILGTARGKLGLFISPSLEWISRKKFLGGLIVLRRFVYIFLQTARYDRVCIWRLLVYFPLAILGLMAWTQGFYNGVKEN